jgi:hypothetical protein
MAKPKAGLSPLKSKNIHRGARDLVSIIIGLLFTPRGYCWLAAMSEAERPTPELTARLPNAFGSWQGEPLIRHPSRSVGSFRTF